MKGQSSYVQIEISGPNHYNPRFAFVIQDYVKIAYASKRSRRIGEGGKELELDTIATILLKEMITYKQIILMDGVGSAQNIDSSGDLDPNVTLALQFRQEWNRLFKRVCDNI